ncbi:MAG: ABC transporter substrate-binding protein, partial [Bryobacteraceae bacterium]
FREFLKEWYPKGDAGDGSNVIGYISAFMTVKVLQMCGDDLTRENLLHQATSLTKVEAPLLLPGITITTTPQRYSPYTQMQIARFDGSSWVPEGPVISIDGIGQ